MLSCLIFGIIALVFAFLLRWYLALLFVFIKALRWLPGDIFRYFRYHKWRNWNGFGLRIYVGMFGTGKTLSAVRYVTQQAKKYNLNVLSNIRLTDVPYTPLLNYQQIINAPSNTIILIDEVSTVFNARSWKDFNINLLFQLLQCRKQRKQLICTAQRFAHVDKLLRDITADVVVCRKTWRMCTNVAYDGWDYENALTSVALSPLWRKAYVSTDKLYHSYDTSELIDNAKRTDFVSNDDILQSRVPDKVIPDKINRKGKKLYWKK